MAHHLVGFNKDAMFSLIFHDCDLKSSQAMQKERESFCCSLNAELHMFLLLPLHEVVQLVQGQPWCQFIIGCRFNQQVIMYLMKELPLNLVNTTCKSQSCTQPISLYDVPLEPQPTPCFYCQSGIHINKFIYLYHYSYSPSCCLHLHISRIISHHIFLSFISHIHSAMLKSMLDGVPHLFTSHSFRNATLSLRNLSPISLKLINLNTGTCSSF